MCGDQFQGRGSRVTWRHLLILAIHLLFLFVVVIPLLEYTPYKGARSALLISLLITPPTLAFLVVLIDRTGPVKNWSMALLLGLFYPSLALIHDANVLGAFLAGVKPPALWAALLLNATLIPPSLIYLFRMVPRLCPGCGKRTLIPLMRLFMKDKRTANSHWCASCGGKYWKGPEGAWRVERRLTWLDVPTPPSTLAVDDPPPARRPEILEPVRRSHGRQAEEAPRTGPARPRA